jgi:hypothetical protein
VAGDITSSEYRLTFKSDVLTGYCCSSGRPPSERRKDKAVATDTNNGVLWSGRLRIVMLASQYLLLSCIGCVESPNLPRVEAQRR